MSSVDSGDLPPASNEDDIAPSGGEAGSTSPVPEVQGGEATEKSAPATATSNDTTAASTTPKKPTKSGSQPSANGGPPSAIEFEPPVACVRRILKKTLPSSSNVGKDAVAAFSRASGIFIIYLTACANDFARENRRQTITANDVLAAIKELEFEEFAPELTTFLERYRELEKNKKNAKLASKAAAEKEKSLLNNDDASKEDVAARDGAKKSGDEKDESSKPEEEEESTTTAQQPNDADAGDNDVSMDPEDEDEDIGGNKNDDDDDDDAATSGTGNDNGGDAETDKAEEDANAMEE